MPSVNARSALESASFAIAAGRMLPVPSKKSTRQAAMASASAKACPSVRASKARLSRPCGACTARADTPRRCSTFTSFAAAVRMRASEKSLRSPSPTTRSRAPAGAHSPASPLKPGVASATESASAPRAPFGGFSPWKAKWTCRGLADAAIWMLLNMGQRV